MIARVGPVTQPGVAEIAPHMASLQPLVEVPRVINLGGNENPLGPSPSAVAAARQAALEMHRYAAVDDTPLKNQIAQKFRLDPAKIVCGPGSDELLARLAVGYLRQNDELVYSVNGYPKIPKYAHIVGGRPVAAADRDLKPNVDALLGAVTDNTRIVMIANPDNPSGRHLTAEEIARLHVGLPDDVLLVLDSAYAEYAENRGYEVPAALVEGSVNVVMTRTFSKLFACAGSRLGWLYGPKPIVDSMNRIGATYPLSNVTMAAGCAALADRDHIARSLQHNRTWRTWLRDELQSLGLYVYPSETNFVLVRFDDPGRVAKEACQHLLRSGIVTAQFLGSAFDAHLRITVGLEEELRALVASLRTYLRS